MSPLVSAFAHEWSARCLPPERGLRCRRDVCPTGIIVAPEAAHAVKAAIDEGRPVPHDREAKTILQQLGTGTSTLPTRHT